MNLTTFLKKYGDLRLWEFVDWVNEGKTDKEIATHLGLAPFVVNRLRKRFFQKVFILNDCIIEELRDVEKTRQHIGDLANQRIEYANIIRTQVGKGRRLVAERSEERVGNSSL